MCGIHVCTRRNQELQTLGRTETSCRVGSGTSGLLRSDPKLQVSTLCLCSTKIQISSNLPPPRLISGSTSTTAGSFQGMAVCVCSGTLPRSAPHKVITTDRIWLNISHVAGQATYLETPMEPTTNLQVPIHPSAIAGLWPFLLGLCMQPKNTSLNVWAAAVVNKL